MATLLVVAVGLVALIGLARFAMRGRVQRVSLKWLAEQQQVDVRTIGRLEHELVVDGEVIARHDNESMLRAVKAEIEAARAGNPGAPGRD